ncbi:DeoR/GlpR family DNA-binding transcription regulator [Knoellia sp. CPCC 206450]|uniref:DeoR/GlpR family DNA-binding transcription regulator n=1 Tax=Knoellia tibetensis TaxID=3404798 RepID=UPI003B42C56E
MFATERQERILRRVRLTGSVRVSDLVEELAVSDMTVRRDIATLAEQGLVARVHGGATSVDAGAFPGVPAPRALDGPARGPGSEVRSAIAAEVAARIEPGTTVALTGGSITLDVAVALGAVEGLTVVTNSLPAADALTAAGGPHVTVVLTGGRRTRSGLLVGPVVAASLIGLGAAWSILGARGIDDQAGLTVPNRAEAVAEKALLSLGAKVLCAVESSRWQTVSLHSVVALPEVDVLVTDSRLRPTARRLLEDEVGELVLAPV